MKKEIAIVLASGGMDSLVSAAIASLDYELAFLHINYGQRTEERELKAFKEQAKFYKAKYELVVNVEHLRKIGGSSLTDEKIPVPEADLERTGIPPSYVPFRNANILSIAVSWGEVIGARKIFFGAVQADSSGYPDCRKEFVDSFNEMVRLGTKPETNISIVAPLVGIKKSEIVRKGVELGAPFELSWSCYERNDIACGNCDSCALRLRAFRERGVKDPINYVEGTRSLW